ncbi:hypothetical protein DL89DRAFT_293141 [Linderina pennispora]|uniref:DASH complex subunit DAD4 n=1 Tax=Linderina pennispora TaxID=61395 RepID=A0A1Y1W7S7_9FUNG|nr:uncharacterized protein DL89DRAFT_293141 [Linderina pennispora]ORX69502.1 hypothetical protein DL89DRAFT_293141 [Linderina pennispora]
MRNPYDEQQTQILARITNNLNEKVEEINEMNSDLVAFSNIWNHYQRNVTLYLNSTKSLEPSTKREGN